MSPKEAVEHTERAAFGVFKSDQVGLGELSAKIIHLYEIIAAKDYALQAMLDMESDYTMSRRDKDWYRMRSKAALELK